MGWREEIYGGKTVMLYGRARTRKSNYLWQTTTGHLEIVDQTQCKTNETEDKMQSMDDADKRRRRRNRRSNLMALSGWHGDDEGEEERRGEDSERRGSKK